jgi:hypothetical protein
LECMPGGQLKCGRYLSAAVRHMSRTTNFRNPASNLWKILFHLIPRYSTATRKRGPFRYHHHRSSSSSSWTSRPLGHCQVISHLILK